MQKETRSTILLSGLLILTIIGVFSGYTLFLRAQEAVKIPAGYTPYQYIQTLIAADRNHDSQINGLDYASGIKRTGEKYLITDPKFGTEVNALERSFDIDNLGVNIDQKKRAIFADQVMGKRYASELVLAEESKLPPPAFLVSDHAYNSKNPPVLGASTDSETTRSGGEGTGASGADSGRSIIPQVLGTVSSYTGSAGFSYPIKVPAGPGGFAPSLGLSYSSSNVDDSLPQDDRFVSSLDDKGNPVTSYYYTKPTSYTPSYAGYGFSIGGAGSIVRDTRQEKNVPILKGEEHHRFILNLPSGLSVQLKYNADTATWVSIPQGFVKIEKHGKPEIRSDARFDFALVDPNGWIITTSDGTRYFFGEEDLGSRIAKDGQIIGSTPLTVKSTRKTNCDANHKCQETQYDALHHTITKDGGMYNEFDIADLCTGDSIDNPCRSYISHKKPALLVTKWLLKKIESPDGKAVNYYYDNYQKAYGQFYKKDWDNALAYATVDSYLTKVDWNDGKYQVLFKTEERPDVGGTQFISPLRLASIDVNTQTPINAAYTLMRRYKLDYSNGDDVMVAASQNPWKASLVKDIREYGYDGQTTTSPISFQYKQYGFKKGPSGSTIYLDTINNGMGGATVYTYEPFESDFKGVDGDRASGLKRVRVIEKKVVDKTSSNKSYRETYNYFNSQQGFADRIRGDNVSGREFLGHAQVEVKTFDFNSDKVLSHTLTKFNQSISGNNCFEPHLAKGQISEQIVYNDLPSGSIEAKKTTSNYVYRLLSQDKNGDPVIAQDNLDPTTKQCTGTDINQPYFVYNKSTVTTVTEPQDSNFVPNGLASSLTEKPVANRSSASHVLSVDLFGNTTKAVALGETDANGKDLSDKDNRYSYGYYLSGNPYWLNNLSYLSYTSNKADCALSNSSCQFGRSNIWYDVFYGDFLSVNLESQRPKLGLVTQTQSVIDDKTSAYSGQEYLRLSDKPEDHDVNAGNDSTDVRVGGVTRSYGPVPNIKTVANPAKDIVLLSQTTYDPFFKTLVTQTENAKGQKTKFEDFNYLLQVPQTVKTQINTFPERYTAARGTFDPLGRSIASFGPDPKNPENTNAYPSSISHYFDRGDAGLVTRSMSLASQTADGKLHYVASDSFYDGLGKVKQSQILSKKVDGSAKRIVQDALYNALGQQAETYEVQTAEPITLSNPGLGMNVNIQGMEQIIASVEPQIAQIDHKVLSKTSYDTLNRPVESVVFDTDHNSTLSTKTFYLVNGVKTVSPKGVVSIATSDSLGRGVNSLTVDPSGDQHVLTMNQYEADMIDKPTKTTYASLKNLSGGNTATTRTTYDKAGRVLSQDEPSLGKMQFDYDVLGNKILESRPARRDVVYEYDILGRNARISYPNEANEEMYKNSSPADTVFTYDTGDNALGKLTSVADHNGKEEYSYDALGRQARVKKTIKSKTYVSSVAYNDLSKPIATTYPNGKKLTTEYDEEGIAAKTSLDNKTLALNPVFDKFGNTTQSSFVLGASTYVNTTARDSMQRTKQIGVTGVYTQTLQYDTKSDLTTVTDQTYKNGAENSVGYSYTYDSYSRLIGAQSPLYTTSYSYDPFGRMGTKNEDQNVTLAFNSNFPFFAPKSITKPGVFIPEPTSPINRTPTDLPTTIPTLTTAPSSPPSSSPSPSSPSSPPPLPTNEPTPTVLPTVGEGTPQPRSLFAVSSIGGSGKVTYNFVYDPNTGAMLEDDKHCFSYNRLNQLTSLRIKKDSTQRCTQSPQFKKLIYFYYDASGTLVLQEEYDPTNTQTPKKQTYYIGSYEEEYTN